MLKIACIGEAMIELQEKPGAENTLTRAIGGDTLNTAIYLKRLLGAKADVHFVTQLGDDPYSEDMISNWQAEGLNCDFIPRISGAAPGMYAIKTDGAGERRFYYWRDNAPAKALFSTPQSMAFIEKLATFDFIYFSGITLAILHREGRQRLLDLCKQVRKNGGKIGFDGNYRPRLWQHREEAANWLGQGYQQASMALPTLEDEQSLVANLRHEDLMERLLESGCTDIAIKRGEEGCIVNCEDISTEVTPTPVSPIVDTTAAGDSFNAGFIAARLMGNDGNNAARLGHQLAGRVISKPGAILKHEDMIDISVSI